jgi:hypothetical protein
MKKIYTIKKDHPVLEVIRQEILNSPGYTKDLIGICPPSIDSRPLCSRDIYGLSFNANNWDVLTINVGFFFNPKSDTSPKFITGVNGYDHYKTSSNVSIKLKTFLERNPEFSNIDEWTIPVVHQKDKLKYAGHYSEERRFSVDGIEGVKYEVSFPENVKDARGILDWSKPACEALTKSYWREVALDIAFNIQRGRSVWVEGVWFSYDYKDGLIEVYNASIHSGSIWDSLKLFEPKKETFDKIKSEIEKGDLVVNEVKFINKKKKQTKFKYEDLVAI